jgi:translation initiation factor 2B subunit (eIF-2B alpha/beta/delta family)
VESLVAARPSMSGLSNVVIRVSLGDEGWGAGARAQGSQDRGGGIADVRSREGVEEVRSRIRLLREEMDGGTRVLARRAAGVLHGIRRLMTLSLSGSVLAVMRELADGERIAEQGDLPPVIVAESRPRCEGLETARRLVEMGYPVSVIADAAVAHHLKECDAAVIGADSVLADGSVYNKMGSLPLALSCRYSGVPLYVVTLAHKIRLTDDEPELEEMDAEELGAMPEGVSARNVYFEPVSGELVTALWSDVGMLTVARIEELRGKWLGATDEGDHG